MAKATPMIALNLSRDIPFSQLVLSQSNVRRIQAGISIEDLAEDIARRGLLQSLNVRPLLDADGKETGTFEIPAGGRRYRALELLVKQKRMGKHQPVPCVVVDAGSAIALEEDSLAENVQRADLHPLDQFRAFAALRENGVDEEDIAARFFVPVTIVRQRLKLAAVSPKLLDHYAEGTLTLTQLMAFTVNPDHGRQEQVWEAIQHSWSKEPFAIKRMLTENTVRANDQRVGFVGIDAYVAAGGAVLQDLFDNDGDGWLQDVALLDRLAGEKLAAEADGILAEGWKWITAAIQHPYGHSQGMTRVWGVPAELSDSERVAMDALVADQQRIEDEYADADELPEEIDARLGEIETQLESFENRLAVFNPEQVAHAGVFVSIDQNGSLLVERGFLRPEDAEALRSDSNKEDTHDSAREEQEPGDTVDTNGSAPPADSDADDEEEGDGGKPLPERLLGELTAFRTLALRDAVAEHPDTALTLLLQQLVTDRFYYRSFGGCLQVALHEQHFPFQGNNLTDSVPARTIAERHENWKADIPEDREALWDWLAGLDAHSRLSLLAHCLSFGVTALHERTDRFSNPSGAAIQRRLEDADRLAAAVALDVAEAGWAPTVDTYLGRVTKAQILDAVREAKGQRAGDRIEHLKKAEMAQLAQELIADSGWLPAALRTPGLSTPPALEAEFPVEDAEVSVDPALEHDVRAELADIHPVAAE
ncbi:ParB N-terminal domain-containing protein [Devosia sp. ZB163]|uniref:ParB/RepB/Spo0J family partition protein n=1 Tax=Devosia sp. ZB163 TaxID=3025938 RepID=UPI00235F2DF4|nr:ParB/RepB/Spo0J family partition protein [Devosia sp. ZB163]MDC9823281.1 ParB N-terminal domain-containing protein [Devosia sp. ZB163]